MMGNILSSKTKFANYRFPEVIKTERASNLKVGMEKYPEELLKNLIPVESQKVYEFKTKKAHNDFEVYNLPSKLTVLTYNIWF